MASILLARSRHALRASSVLSFRQPLTFRPLSSTASPSPADIIAEWTASILKKPVLIERDTIRSQTLQQLAMTLSKETPTSATAATFKKGALLPVNWHHAFFPPMIGENDLGKDGYEMTHAPPAPFLARMWAGGGVEQNPANLLRVGQDMLMKTKCTNVDIKQNRSGDIMVFVSLEKQIENEHGWALTDTRTLVYMEKDENNLQTPKSKLVKPRREADLAIVVHPTAVLLFRYSALSFNSHLIHYEHQYANKVEGYPGCLVHGPLTSTFMLETLRQNLKPGQIIKNFRYRALSPLYVDQPIKICTKNTATVPTMEADIIDSYEVWVENPEGGLAMSGTVEIAQELKA
ncbi:hypothetical protein BGX21_010636 [Mortierella sp. AD011]|nr:hypothetical protein BGX20_004324 [Mortierella sp. AD010]KAF9393748.1 hypothetical protein BGX21_010636 [Mortierella sp. AD011]